jgi:hypothetical protein
MKTPMLGDPNLRSADLQEKVKEAVAACCPDAPPHDTSGFEFFLMIRARQKYLTLPDDGKCYCHRHSGSMEAYKKTVRPMWDEWADEILAKWGKPMTPNERKAVDGD